MIDDYEYIALAQENEEYAEELLKKYIPLIKNILKKYTYNQNGIDYNDLVQEGIIGFYNAIETYNANKGVFLTYATKCIENQIKTIVISGNRQKNAILNDAISLEKINEQENAKIDKLLKSEQYNPSILLQDSEYEINYQETKQKLTDFELNIFELKKSGFTYQEISEILDVTKKQIDNALQRIRKKLK